MVTTRNHRRFEAQSLPLSSSGPVNMKFKKHPPPVLPTRRSQRPRTNISTLGTPSPRSDIGNSALADSSSSHNPVDNEPVEISTSDSEDSDHLLSNSESNPSDSTFNKPASSSSKHKTSSPPALSDESNGETSVQQSVSSSEDEQSSDNVYEQSLPKRLFATDRYPTEGRVNSYSKPQYLVDIISALRGTPELQKLKNSPFSSLFELPVRRCSLSGKLVHNVLCRQILTKNDEELWFTFGGYPLRFSLQEFERLTGLPCGSYPDKAILDAAQKPSPGASSYWNTLLGRDKKDVSIEYVVNKLKTETCMPGWKKLRLALLVIVEGVLVCGTQPIRASLPVVEMLRNLNFFYSYPWGRHSFDYTIRMVKVGKVVSRRSLLIKKLKQPTLVLHGFPIVIQLMLFQSIPLLLRFLPASHDLQTFYDNRVLLLPKLKTYHTHNVLEVENDNQLSVTPTVSLCSEFGDACPCNNSSSDAHVRHMLSLVEGGYKFSKHDWLGGDESMEKLCICKKKKHIRCTCGTSLGDDRNNIHGADRSTFTASYSNEIANLRSEVSRLQQRTVSMKAELTSHILSEVKLLLVSSKCRACGHTSNLSHVFPPHPLTNLSTDRESPTAHDAMDNTWESEFSEGFRPDLHQTSGQSSMEPEIVIPAGIATSLAASHPTVPHTTAITLYRGLCVRNGASFFQSCLRNVGFPPKLQVRCPDGSTSTSPTPSETFLKFPLHKSTFMNSNVASGELPPYIFPSSAKPIQCPQSAALLGVCLSHPEEINDVANVNVISSPSASTSSPQVEDIPVRPSKQPLHVQNNTSKASAGPVVNIKATRAPRSQVTSKPCVPETNFVRRSTRHVNMPEKHSNPSSKFESLPLRPAQTTVPVKVDKDHASAEPVSDFTPSQLPETAKHSESYVRKRKFVLPPPPTAKRPKNHNEIPLPVNVTYVLFPSPHPNLIQKFKKKLQAYRKLHYEMDGVEVTKTFFSDIYTPQTCLTETHMDFILRPFWRNRGTHLSNSRVVVLDTLLTQLLSSQYSTFRDQPSSSSSSYEWDNLLCSLIEGTVGDRKESTMWFRDVDTVYVPMNWGNGHWVGLVICLKSCHVDILDPLLTCTSDKEVDSFMHPIMEMLPCLIKASCMPSLITHLDFVDFSYERVQGVPQNYRGGDSGPFVIKLIELHSHKYSFNTFGDFPDDVVDNFRMQYAIDVYRDFVSPAGL